MNTTDRILGEARKVRPPTKRELTDPEWAYDYAKDVIGGRWPEGEEVIATDAVWAYLYAKNVISGRFPEGEAAIATEPQCAKEYLEMCPEARLGWAMRGWIPLEDAWGI